MKLSNETLAILKNFASINAGLEFKKGNKISTISSTKTILAKATLHDDFPQDFCVYDLNEFLSVHSLYKNTELSFDEKHIILKADKSKTRYITADRSVIVCPPDKEIKIPSTEGSFLLKEEDLIQSLKNASVLQSPNLAFESDGSKVFITAFDAKNDSANVNTIEVGDAQNDKVFKAVFLTENFRMIPSTYNVQVSKAGLAHFKNEAGDLEYYIAIEAKDSKFGG